MVQLHGEGKPRNGLIKEYELTPSAFDHWVRRYNASASFEEKDNSIPEEEELIQLRKVKQKLMMESNILKQAALIMGRK